MSEITKNQRKEIVTFAESDRFPWSQEQIDRAIRWIEKGRCSRNRLEEKIIEIVNK